MAFAVFMGAWLYISLHVYWGCSIVACMEHVVTELLVSTYGIPRHCGNPD